MSEVSRDQERWLDVVGYEGLYSVSDQGRVRIEERVDASGYRWQARVLGCTTRKGYRDVTLTRDGKGTIYRVHRLVLMAFVGPCPAGMETCHGPGGPKDNRLVNLRWDTREENARDQVRHGTHYRANLTECPYGHALADPNLIKRAEDGRHRRCWACYVIRQRNNYERRCGRPLLDHRVESDKLYARLLESGGAIRGDRRATWEAKRAAS